MAKRKYPQDLEQTPGEPTSPKPPRKSARLQARRQQIPQESSRDQDQILSHPNKGVRASPKAVPNTRRVPLKRRRSRTQSLPLDTESIPAENQSSTAAVDQTQLRETLQREDRPYDPIKCWAATGNWPSDYITRGRKMSSSTATSSTYKRRSHTDQKALRDKLGVYYEQNASKLTQGSKDLCAELLAEKFDFAELTMWPEHEVDRVFADLQAENEAHYMIHVLPRFCPPALVLSWKGLDNIMPGLREGVDAIWHNTLAKGSTQSKPDYFVGFQESAFKDDEVTALKAYSSVSGPFMFNSRVAFPFFACEAKCGDEALDWARSQNIANGAVAVSAMLELYKAAYGKSDPKKVEELYGQILFFSVSHDLSGGDIWGHFAVKDENDLDSLGKPREKFYFHYIGQFSIHDTNGGRNLPHNFVRALYKKFAPRHLKRIKDAAGCLVKIQEEERKAREDERKRQEEERKQLKTPASTTATNEELQEGQKAKRKRGPSSSKSTTSTTKAALVEELDELKDRIMRSDHQHDQLMERMEQQNKQMEQQNKQMEQQNKQMEQQNKQMEQQNKQQKEQMELQNKQIIQLMSMLAEKK